MFYSQCNEDKIIYEKYIKDIHIDNPIYLEMGAMDGLYTSNTLFFEKELNWTGILIEPHPINFSNLLVNRPNNKLFNCLVSNNSDEIEYIYYDIINLSGISGVKNTLTKNNIDIFYTKNNPWISSMIDNNQYTIMMKPRTLTDIIHESKVSKIDFFSLDVEGHELNVIKSFDWSIPVNIFLIENNTDTNTINQIMISKDYKIVEIIGPNTLYILNSFYNLHYANKL